MLSWHWHNKKKTNILQFCLYSCKAVKQHGVDFQTLLCSCCSVFVLYTLTLTEREKSAMYYNKTKNPAPFFPFSKTFLSRLTERPFLHTCHSFSISSQDKHSC